MTTITTKFSDIGLHDADIESIERHDGDLILKLSHASLPKGHPRNPLSSRAMICVDPTLIFRGVIREESRTWLEDEKQWSPHRDPSTPLENEILKSELEDGCFVLNGFHKDGWSEWRIWANGFELTFQKTLPYC